VVVGDQGSLDGGAGLPVVPDAGVEGEEPLDDAGLESCGDAAAVAFEAELAFQGPDDGLDALAEPVRERALLLLVLAGGADQGQSQAAAGEELLGALSGQALVGDDGGAGRGAVRRLAFQGLPGLVPLAVQLGVRRSRTCATARQASSASVTCGGLPGPRRQGPRNGMIRSVSST
jgi:hypothetical protein